MKWKVFLTTLSKTDRFYTVPLFFSVFTFLILHIMYFGFLGLLPSRIPLFYSLPWGEHQLANKQQFLILPTVVLLMTVINTAFAWRLHDSQIILRRMLFISLAAINLIILIAGIKILGIFLA